jgi:FPC/CPF motif-containing protein YcgG
VNGNGYELGVYGQLGTGASARALAGDLEAFLARDTGAALRAFVAVFPARPPADESEFERRLWMLLQRLHERDEPSAEWDPHASADPDDPRFAFSFGGHALFVIGLHPRSSRDARRFRWPALVFNPHEQLDRLRAQGRYERLRAAVRERELTLQGSLNPNLADFGERSEARQYSGRETELEWRCPFHRRQP